MKLLNALLCSAISVVILGCQERDVKAIDLNQKDGVTFYQNESEPFSGKATAKYPSSHQIKSITEYDNGVRDGIMRVMHKSGEKKLEATFVDGDIVRLTSWNTDGDVLNDLKTKDGMLHGALQWGNQHDGYYTVSKIEYKDGIPKGKAIRTKIENNGTQKVIGETVFESGIMTYMKERQARRHIYNSNGELKIFDEPREFVVTTTRQISGDTMIETLQQYDVEDDRTISYEDEKERPSAQFNEVQGEYLIDNASVSSLTDEAYVLYYEDDEGSYSVSPVFLNEGIDFDLNVSAQGRVSYGSCNVDDEFYYHHKDCERELGSADKMVSTYPHIQLAVDIVTQ